MLRRATAGDIDAIMAIERRPGYEHFVGRSSADFHARAVDDPDYIYLVGLTEAGDIVGIAILRDLTNAQGNTCLKRFAVGEPGRGLGRRLLGEVIGWYFPTRAPTASGSTISSPTTGPGMFMKVAASSARVSPATPMSCPMKAGSILP